MRLRVEVKKCGRVMKINRKDLANPFRSEKFIDRLKKSDAINLRDNYKIKNLGNGYNEVIAIDKTKKF